ncbi:MAG: hypothetical protein WBQ94_21000 [Terracidiphilus sp.]
MTLPSETKSPISTLHHRGPHPGVLAIVYMVLFIAGLYPVVSFTGGTHYPGPWESAKTIASYFQANPTPVLICTFLQFGAAVPLGIYIATVVSRLQFLGVRAAGVYIALFGGFATVFDMMAGAHVAWAMIRPGIAQDATLVQALYFIGYGLGGPGFSVPMGLFIAGVSVTAWFTKLLPKWLLVFGLMLAVCGELSWISMVIPNAVPLIPLTRFPGFIWLIAVGFLLPSTVTRRISSTEIQQ